MTTPASDNGSRPTTATPPTGRGAASDRAAVLKALQQVQNRSGESAVVLRLQHENDVLTAQLAEVRSILGQAREETDVLVAPEHYQGVITQVVLGPRLRVVAYAGGAWVRAEVHPDVDHSRLRVGALGYLTKARNCLLDVSDRPPSPGTRIQDIKWTS